MKIRTIVLMLAVWGCYFQNAWTQQDLPNWEVGRVYVPRENQLSHIPLDYQPIKIEHLNEQLDVIRQNQQLRQVNPLRLDTAVYLATINSDLLISDGSFWKFAGAAENQLAAVGKVSLALRDAKAIPEDGRQLSIDQRFTSDGSIEVDVSSGQQQRWFGFQAASSRIDSTRQFKLQIPRAGMAQMLISADIGVQLASSDVVVRPIAVPDEYLPTNWPSSLAPRRSLRQAWWLVHLSGISQFSISYSENTDDQQLTYPHGLASADLLYEISADTLLASATFDFATEANGEPVALDLDRSLKIRSIEVNGQSVDWRIVATSETRMMAQLIPTNFGIGTVIEVHTISNLKKNIVDQSKRELADSLDVSLPSIAVANSTALSGTISIKGDDSVAIAPVSSNLKFSNSALDPTTDAPNLAWKAQWSGQPTAVTVRLSPQTESWTTSSFCRINIQEGSVLAHLSMILSGSALRSNQLRLPVLPGWTIDSVATSKDASNNLRAFVTSDPGGEEILLTWQGQPALLNTQIDIVASAPIDSQAASFAIQNPRIVKAPDPFRPGYWSLKSSSHFRMRSNIELLPFAVAKEELPIWQQSLIADENLPIYRDLSDANSRFIFDATSAWFSANIVSLVEPLGLDRFRLTTQLHCQPNSGTVNRIEMVLPIGQKAAEWKFVLATGSESEIPIQSQTSQSSTEADPKTFLTLHLPVSTGSPFMLQSSYDLSLTEEPTAGFELPIPGLPTASNVESTIVLPANWAHFSDRTGIELLASTNCCSDEILKTLSQGSSQWSSDAPPQENIVIAKVDGSQAHLFKLSRASEGQKSSWVWNESIAHDLTASGYCRHSVTLDLQSGADRSISLQIPADWQPETVIVDGAERPDFFWQADKLEIEVSANRRSQVTVHFHSKWPTLDWLTWLAIVRPQYDIPVLQRSERLSLPRAYLALVEPPATISSKVTERLSPRSWWQHFSPNATYASFEQLPNTSAPTYNLTSRRSDEQDSLWIIHRGSLATILLTILLVAAALNWYLILKSIRLWWTCSVTVLVLLLLLPEVFIIPGQVLLLASLLGALARLLSVVTLRPAALRQGPLSVRRTAVSLLLVSTLMQTSQAQSSVDFPKNAETKIFGVIIPYEGSVDAPDAKYAYIPAELQNLLPDFSRQVRGQQASPKILSADYVMKMRQNPRDSTPIQDLSVELKVLATDTARELLLPYVLQTNSDPKLNGQTKLFGDGIFYLTEDGIIFRPDSLGVMTVSLSLQPSVSDSTDQQYKFSTSIPPVPNASLRIVPNSRISGIKINANGGMQRLYSGDYLAYLGAIDQLQMEWNEDERNSSTFATEYTTETWVRSQDDNVSVACQITIERGQSLSEEYELSVDSDWEPVGIKWGDASLISSKISNPLKRRIIRVRLSESAGTTCHVRMLLAQPSKPRSMTLDVPFLSLDGFPSKEKLFWWSPDLNSNWIPDGLGAMPSLQARTDWGELRIASERSGYQVVGSGSNVRLRQQLPNNGLGSLVELTSLHLFVSHTELEYDASWDQLASVDDDLIVDVPAGSELKRLEINGTTTTAFSQQNGGLRIPLTTNTTSAKLKLVLELPPMRAAIQQLPRVHLRDLPTRQSNYQIYRGTGLDVHLLPTDSGLVFTGTTPTNRRSSIERLETLVGEANLPPELLNEPALAAKLEIKTRPASPQQSLVTYLSRNGGGWKATVRCTWDANTPGLDYAFFDVPLSLRDDIETGAQVCIFKPHEDSTRTNLCIPIATMENEVTRSVEFSFPVSAMTSSQSITLPRITANHGVISSPVVALPKTIEGKAVRWEHADRIVDSSWYEQSAVAEQSEFEYRYLHPNQTKLVWHSRETVLSNAQVELVWLDLTSSASHKLAGIVNYWIAPKNQITQHFEVPVGCEILGVDCGNRRTTWTVQGTDLRVTLQPNAVPLNVRIMAQWRIDTSQRQTAVRVPEPQQAIVPPHLFVSLSASFDWSVDEPSNVSTVTNDELSKHWAAIVSQAADTLAGMPKRQASNWLASWSPENYRIREETMLDLARQVPLSPLLGSDGSEISVGELWQRIEEMTGSSGQWLAEAGPSMVSADSAGIQWRVDGSTIHFSRRTGTIQYDAQSWFFALGIAGVGVWGLMYGSSVKRWVLTVLANQPWLYWAFLSAVLWIALPVNWPSGFVLILSLWMCVCQFVDHRRRTRRYSF